MRTCREPGLTKKVNNHVHNGWTIYHRCLYKETESKYKTSGINRENADKRRFQKEKRGQCVLKKVQKE